MVRLRFKTESKKKIIIQKGKTCCRDKDRRYASEVFEGKKKLNAFRLNKDLMLHLDILRSEFINKTLRAKREWILRFLKWNCLTKR
jgi:hypothetical protein